MNEAVSQLEQAYTCLAGLASVTKQILMSLAGPYDEFLQHRCGMAQVWILSDLV